MVNSDSERAFQISIPQAKIDLLRKKLELSTLPDELEDAGWEYGVPLANLKRLVERWRNGYDWKKHETQINAELPQFTRDIEVDSFGTLNIHYIHKRSDIAAAIPLLFVHGWPGHFLEVRKILPLLTQGSEDYPAFHIVAVGLPGYGFSQAPVKKGFDRAQYAEVGHKLMLALGYDQYIAQGGDWGYTICRTIAEIYGGGHCKAWHTNMAVGRRPQTATETPLTAKEQAGLERTNWFRTFGTGYHREQATQPQTLGYSLADSPTGLLAWIYEKLVNWSDAYPWEDDEVLTWVSIYWFSRAGPTASLRIYFETEKSNLDKAFAQPGPTNLPLGISYFPRDIFVFPRSWTRSVGNVVFDSEHKDGGHFAAYEKPEYLASDLRKMFMRDGPAFGVVSGKTGYARAAAL